MKVYKNFSEIVFYQAETCPDRIFLHDIKSGRTYNFRDFNRIVENTANFLLTLGIKKGELITAVIRNSPEYCFFYFACLRVGAIFNPLPYASHHEEIKKNIRLVEPRLVFIDDIRRKEFENYQDYDDIHFVPVGENRQFEVSVEKLSTLPKLKIDINDKRAACLYYSSGTTDYPKGILFSHKNMVANVASIFRGFRFVRNREIHLVFLPLGHTASINYSILPCMYSGGQIILAEDFWSIRTQIWNLIEKHRVTYIEMVPTVLYSILNIYINKIKNDLSSLRFVGCGSAPLSRGIQIEFEKRFDLKVANLYGLSETGPTHIDYPLSQDWQPGSIGFPLDVNEVKIMGDDDREMKENKIGEIAVKGDNVFIGYYKNDCLYRKMVRRKYFYTGDLGYRDKNGKFYFVGRKKNLIIKGGINIAPEEIDEILLQHPAVKEAVTIGRADELFGEELESYVVLKDNKSLSEIDILNFCSQYLSKIKIPKKINIISMIPKTYSGKLLRKRITDIYKDNENGG